MPKASATTLRAIREAMADYIATEGCSCCSSPEKHREAKARLAKLLRVPKYEDGSGYDFGRFRRKPSERGTSDG